MKITSVTAAVVLVVLALMYLLVRLDIIDADGLRFVPAILAIVIACAVIYAAVNRRRSLSTAKPKKKG